MCSRWGGDQRPGQDRHKLFFIFKESLIAFILTRIWRWTAASSVPVGLSQLLGPVPALPTVYIHIFAQTSLLSRMPCYPPSHDEPGYRLTPLFVLPYHLASSPLPVSHPRTAHQMCCILCCPSIAYATGLFAFPNLP